MNQTGYGEGMAGSLAKIACTNHPDLQRVGASPLVPRKGSSRRRWNHGLQGGSKFPEPSRHGLTWTVFNTIRTSISMDLRARQRNTHKRAALGGRPIATPFRETPVLSCAVFSSSRIVNRTPVIGLLWSRRETSLNPSRPPVGLDFRCLQDRSTDDGLDSRDPTGSSSCYQGAHAYRRFRLSCVG